MQFCVYEYLYVHTRTHNRNRHCVLCYRNSCNGCQPYDNLMYNTLSSIAILVSNTSFGCDICYMDYMYVALAMFFTFEYTKYHCSCTLICKNVIKYN